MNPAIALPSPNRIFISILFVAALNVCLNGCSQKIDSHAEFVEVAYQHERNGKLPEAVAAYRKALKLDSKVATTWYDLGVAYAGMQQFPEAVDAYSEALKLDSEMERAYNNRAAAYARLNQFEPAVSDCDSAIALSPADAMAWRNRGLACHDLGRLDQAIADYDESIRLNGQVAETYLYRGNVYLERESWERALEDFNHAVHLDEELAAAWLSRAQTLVRLNRRPEADESYTKAEQLGADVTAVVLDELDPSLAPVAVTVDAYQKAVDFVQNWLSTRQQETVTATAPWVLQSVAGSANPTAYVVRLLQTEVDSPASTAVEFTNAELESVQQARDIQTTLVIVRQVTEPQQDGLKTSFRVIASLDNWEPDLTHMQPVSWSLPLADLPAMPKSDAATSGNSLPDSNELAKQ